VRLCLVISADLSLLNFWKRNNSFLLNFWNSSHLADIIIVIISCSRFLPNYVKFHWNISEKVQTMLFIVEDSSMKNHTDRTVYSYMQLLHLNMLSAGL